MSNYINKVSCDDGITILGIAVQNNDDKLTKLLLEENGADPNIYTSDLIGEYPLTIAIKNNNYNIVKLLLDNGAKVRYDEDSGEMPPLIFASGEGNYEIVKLLLDKGANVNEVYENETTALFNAVIEKKLRITKLLLDNGADINWKDEDGDSALSVATKNKSYQIMKLLEKYILDKIILNIQRIAKVRSITIDIGFEIFLNLVKEQMESAGSTMNVEEPNTRKKLYRYFIKFNETTANVKKLKEQKGGSKRPRDSLCVKAKNLGIRLTRNVNGKRVYKTETMLRNEIKRK